MLKKFWNDGVIISIAKVDMVIESVILAIKWSIRGARSGWTVTEITTEIDHEIDELASRILTRLSRFCVF